MLREHRTRTTTAVAAAAAVLMLAGCGGTIGATPTPTPTPTWTCTPDDSGDPCTAAKAAAQAEQAEAYAEAEHTYREFTKERNRLAMSGGTPTPTPEMERLATGPYLEAVAGFLASGYEEGRKATGPLVITYVEPRSYAEGIVTLLSCEDGRDIRIVDRDGSELGSGAQGTVEIVVERSPEGWKVLDGFDSEESVCA